MHTGEVVDVDLQARSPTGPPAQRDRGGRAGPRSRARPGRPRHEPGAGEQLDEAETVALVSPVAAAIRARDAGPRSAISPSTSPRLWSRSAACRAGRVASTGTSGGYSYSTG